MQLRNYAKSSFAWGAVAMAVVVLGICVQLLAAQGTGPAPKKSFLNPPGLSTPPGYTHVVSVEGGRTVFIAGQVALNAKGELIGKGDLRAQTTQVFENLKTALAAAGGSWNDVVKINWYIAGYNAEMLPMLREVRSKYVPATNPPASSLVGVAALANPDLLIEIEAIAVVR